MKIRFIEVKLGCHLQVVHVPGTLMIHQGTDNLSRGIWCSPFHAQVDQCELTKNLFAPIKPDVQLVTDIIQRYGLDPRWTMCDWQHAWPSYDVLNQFTVWFPPPELARQLLLFLLFAWSERPLTSQALIIVPRVLAGFWQGLSKHVIELETISPLVYPLFRPPPLPIPFVVLHLAPHIRRLPTRDRLDRAPLPWWAKEHKQAAEDMRGL